MEDKYAPPDHPVFQLTPPAFHTKAQYFLTTCLSSPKVTFDSFWAVYKSLLHLFHEDRDEDQGLTQAIDSCLESDKWIHEETLALLEGQQELCMGGQVVGEGNNYIAEVDPYAGAFFRDEENYFMVEFSDEEELDSDQGVALFTDEEEEMEVEKSLLM